MKGVHILFAICLLALASSLASAYDPSPLLDFCVAIKNIKDGVFVDGKFCKDPKLVKAEDFYYQGLNRKLNTQNELGSMFKAVTVKEVAGLNMLGLSMARTDYAPNGGLFPPHIHPRATETIVVLEGTLYAGFVTSEPSKRFISKILNPGDFFVFPMGLVHFQYNIAKTPAVAFSAFNSQNPGLVTVANATFGPNPRIIPEVLTKAYKLDINTVKNLQSKFSSSSY